MKYKTLPHILKIENHPRSFNQKIQDFIDKIQNSNDLDQIWEEICCAYKSEGIDFLVYMYMRPSAPDDNPLIRSNMPRWWADHYEENQLARHDPFFITCCTFAPIYTGSEFLSEHKDVLSEAQRRFICEAGETGAISGISSPVRLANSGHFGGWNLLTSLPRSEFVRYLPAYCDRLQLIGFVAHEALQGAAGYSKKTETSGRLTPREKECLLWLSRGLRGAAISKKMGIAQVTVDLHLKHCRTKLRAATREEALVKAVLSKEIAP